MIVERSMSDSGDDDLDWTKSVDVVFEDETSIEYVTRMMKKSQSSMTMSLDVSIEHDVDIPVKSGTFVNFRRRDEVSVHTQFSV